jgi:hypothetical protein
VLVVSAGFWVGCRRFILMCMEWPGESPAFLFL